MIASFSRRFIFIKTRKTAGTSIEIALTPFCGPDDILSPITLEDERLRLIGGKVAARNYVADADIAAAFSKAVLSEDEEAFKRAKRRSRAAGGFYNHMPASEIKAKLPAAFWDSAFKFTVERHPYEKVVSRAFFHRGDLSSSEEIRDLIDRYAKRNSNEDIGLYSIDGEIIVDDILRQENLIDDLKRTAGKLGFEIPEALPRAKSKYRSDRRPAREILTDEQKQRIYERHRRTFELLNYEP
jgi:hypothetical protein